MDKTLLRGGPGNIPECETRNIILNGLFLKRDPNERWQLSSAMKLPPPRAQPIKWSNIAISIIKSSSIFMHWQQSKRYIDF